MRCAIAFFFAFIFLGCGNVTRDPADIGDVACCPRIIFEPQGRRDVQCCNPIEEVEIDLDKTWTLSDLIDLGLQNNPATQRAWAFARARAFELYGVRSSYFPQIELEESYLINDSKVHLRDGVITEVSPDLVTTDTTTTGGNGYIEAFSSTLNMQYLLFDFGKRSATVRAFKHALEAANWTHHFELQQVIFNVSRAYYDYLEQKALVLSNEKNYENAKLTAEAANAQFEAGIRTKVDMLQARTDFYQAELDLENRRALEKIAMARLAQYLGLPPETVLKVEDLPFKIEPKNLQEGIKTLIQLAKSQRADLASQEAIIWKEIEEIEAAKANALPTLSAQGSLNRTLYSKAPVLSSHDYTGALVLDVPVFHGFLDYNEIRKSKEDYQAAYYDWRNSEEAVIVDVITSYYQYITANKNITTTQEYLNYALEAYDAVAAGYQEGVQTIVDLLAAQNILAEARSRHIQSRAVWLRGIVNIAFTTGMLGIDAKMLSVATPEMIHEDEIVDKECKKIGCECVD